MRTASMRAAVMNISMNTPCATFTFFWRNVLEKLVSHHTTHADSMTYLTDKGPGVSAMINADAAMAPSSWAMQYRTNRTGLITPMSMRARETLGLKRPPVIRKKSQAETSKLRPMQVDIYITCSTVEEEPPGLAASLVVAWIPPRPSKRKKVVPTNSSRAACKSSRILEKCAERRWFDISRRRGGQKERLRSSQPLFAVSMNDKGVSLSTAIAGSMHFVWSAMTVTGDTCDDSVRFG